MSYLCRNRTKLYYFSSSCTLYLSKTAVLVCDSLDCRCSETEQTRKERARCMWDKGSVIKMLFGFEDVRRKWLTQLCSFFSSLIFIIHTPPSLRNQLHQSHRTWPTACCRHIDDAYYFIFSNGTKCPLSLCQYWKCFLSLEQTVLCRSCKLRLKPCFCSNQC